MGYSPPTRAGSAAVSTTPPPLSATGTGAAAAARVAPMPTAWSRCRCLPSVCSDGATITSARWNDAMSSYPQVAIDVRRLPIRLKVPSFSCAGPSRICSIEPFWVVLTRAPRGSDGWNVAMPQWKPRPGASYARASGEPTMTASAPQANAFETSPPLRMPPSAITLTYSPVSSMCCERAAWTSAIAVAWGTPMPSTPRVVQAAPGPTPTSTPTAPVRIRWRPVEYDAQPPTTTGTGTSRVNSLRFNGSDVSDTCSAETTVP